MLLNEKPSLKNGRRPSRNAAGAISGAETQSPAAALRGLYLERRAKNPNYSTRAFARDLGISQTLLSLIMSGKRSLSAKIALQISASLGLSNQEQGALLGEQLTSGQRSTHFVDYDSECFRTLSQWYHLAILDLTLTRGFKSDRLWIARRLGITPIEAADAIERLIQLGFLVLEKGKIRKSRDHIYFTPRQADTAIANHHKQMIGKALAQLDDRSATAFDSRSITSMTFTTSASQIDEANQRIKKFQEELVAFLEKKTVGEEVYQLNVQLFPLTKSVPAKLKKETL